ncbi:hypothetical protein LguiB_026582 [Lonicera macranthoides]
MIAARSSDGVNFVRQLSQMTYPWDLALGDFHGKNALHMAASSATLREMVLYLLSVTNEDVEPEPFKGESGVKLVHGLVASRLYDICLDIIKRHPQLAWEEPSPLSALALKRPSFKSGSRFNFYQRFIYYC